MLVTLYSPDELRKMPYGHGYMEYAPDEDDSIPWEEYLAEVVWMGDVVLIKDCKGGYSTGSWHVGDDYGRADGWRIWSQKPPFGVAKLVEWYD